MNDTINQAEDDRAKAYEGQPPYSPEHEMTDDERKEFREAADRFLDSQVMVKRDLIAHLSLAFTQGAVWARNRYLAARSPHTPEAVEPSVECLECGHKEWRNPVSVNLHYWCERCGKSTEWKLLVGDARENPMIEILDKIDKLPSGETVYHFNHELEAIVTNITTDELIDLATHLRKLMRQDEIVRKYLTGEVDPRAEEKS